jgi:predicted nucleic acid-binding protein
VRLFLDTSVLIAAMDSARDASRMIFDGAHLNGWELKTSRYVETEAGRHLPRRTAAGREIWPSLGAKLVKESDVVVVRGPVVFPVPKDRPVLFTAFACADVLLTLDRGDFLVLLGNRFYHLEILTPGAFIKRERLAGRLVTA